MHREHIANTSHLAQSSPEETQRRFFIVRTILLCIIVITFVGTIINQLTFVRESSAYDGIHPVVMPIVFALFVGLFMLLQRRKVLFVSLCLILIFWFGALYMFMVWGVDVPIGLLFMVLVMSMSGVFISTRFSILMTLLTFMAMFGIHAAHAAKMLHYHMGWRLETLRYDDIFVLVGMLFFVSAFTWLYNREITRSFEQIKRSEKALMLERDLLEKRIEERTAELKLAQIEKMTQLYRFADFGKLASGLVHDLVGPLTAMTLNLELMDEFKEHPSVRRAMESSRRIEQFVTAMRKRMNHQKVFRHFSVLEEMSDCMIVLKHKAQEMSVHVKTEVDPGLEFYGNPYRFHEVVLNLLSNAIDAFDGATKQFSDRQITMSAVPIATGIVVTVTDTGCGIPPEHLPHIFEPLYTTKSEEKGTGLGLAIAKDIVEKEFNGTIHVQSTVGVGTTFIVTFAI